MAVRLPSRSTANAAPPGVSWMPSRNDTPSCAERSMRNLPATVSAFSAVSHAKRRTATSSRGVCGGSSSRGVRGGSSSRGVRGVSSSRGVRGVSSSRGVRGVRGDSSPLGELCAMVSFVTSTRPKPRRLGNSFGNAVCASAATEPAMESAKRPKNRFFISKIIDMMRVVHRGAVAGLGGRPTGSRVRWPRSRRF